MIEPRNSERSLRQGKIVCLLMCLFFMIAGSFFFIRDLKYLWRRSSCSESVSAVSSVPAEYASSRKEKTYYPVFHYTYRDQTYTAQYDISSGKNYYPAGTTVALRIDPDDPTVYYVVDDPILRRDLLECLGIFLAGAVPLALYLFVRRRKLLDIEIGKKRSADEETLRAALEKQTQKMERIAEKMREREKR